MLIPKSNFLTVTAIIVVLTAVLAGCGDPSVARVFGGFDLRFKRSVEASADYEPFKTRFGEVTRAVGSRSRQLKHFANAFERVRDDYVHATDEAKMIRTAVGALDKIKSQSRTVSPEEASESALDAIMATLDPHSSYLNPQEFKESQVATSGRFGGLGRNDEQGNEGDRDNENGSHNRLFRMIWMNRFGGPIAGRHYS